MTQSSISSIENLSLDLKSNSIGKIGCDWLGKALASYTNLKSLDLDLESNYICDEGLELLSVYLS